jgi:aryl-alcohol dehydrogenase-like predicted oxidoreductase
MLNRGPEVEILPACKHYGLGVVPYSPIARGVLTGKYLPGQPLPAGSRATDEKGGARMVQSFLDRPNVLERVQQLRPVADELGLSLAQLAVAWVLQNANVAAAIIGASRPEQVVENVKASGVEIPAELMTRIDEILGDAVISDPAETAKSSPAPR